MSKADLGLDAALSLPSLRGDALQEQALPAGTAGAWCRIVAYGEAEGPWWAKFELLDRDRGHVVRQGFLGVATREGRRSTLIHVPLGSTTLGMRVFGRAARLLRVEVIGLGRILAACMLFAGGWGKLPGALRGDRAGLAGRVRATLGQAPARAGEAPPYAFWLALYGTPAMTESSEQVRRIARSLCIVVAEGEGGEKGLAETLTSLREQSLLPSAPVVVLRHAGNWADLDSEWVAVAASGETYAPDAIACFCEALSSRPGLGFLCADTDERDGNGARSRPVFKPKPGPVLLPSGYLTTGLCLFHRSALVPLLSRLPLRADHARLALALSAAARQEGESDRIARILTHARQGVRRPATASRRSTRQTATGRVSIVVPSAARSSHVLQCLRRVACGTDYSDFEICVAVSQVDATNRRQAAVLRALASLPRTRILDLGMRDFNFAEAINRAAATVTGEMLLLLNDDVAPVAPDWLARMVWLAQMGASIVGARLLYGNDSVQHGGVIMGLADLCEHDGRFAEPRDRVSDGVTWLDRDVSAVTAACMLVRADLFRSVGGLDTAFAIALNDVDFCLRARAAGASVAMSSGTILHHFESLSLGRHYGGARASFEAKEVQLLRERWGAVIAEDPFYNPQASREPGREWQPAFPPAQALHAVHVTKNHQLT